MLNWFISWWYEIFAIKQGHENETLVLPSVLHYARIKTGVVVLFISQPHEAGYLRNAGRQ